MTIDSESLLRCFRLSSRVFGSTRTETWRASVRVTTTSICLCPVERERLYALGQRRVSPTLQARSRLSPEGLLAGRVARDRDRVAAGSAGLGPREAIRYEVAGCRGAAESPGSGARRRPREAWIR